MKFVSYVYILNYHFNKILAYILVYFLSFFDFIPTLLQIYDYVVIFIPSTYELELNWTPIFNEKAVSWLQMPISLYYSVSVVLSMWCSLTSSCLITKLKQLLTQMII